MADDLDIASEREELARDMAIRAHMNRPAAPVPLCEECDEKQRHVTSSGVIWRFCSCCAEEFLRGKAA